MTRPFAPLSVLGRTGRPLKKARRLPTHDGWLEQNGTGFAPRAINDSRVSGEVEAGMFAEPAEPSWWTSACSTPNEIPQVNGRANEATVWATLSMSCVDVVLGGPHRSPCVWFGVGWSNGRRRGDVSVVPGGQRLRVDPNTGG